MSHSYFEHYQRVNDLTPPGRRAHWRYLEKTIGPHLPRPAARPFIIDIGCGAGIVLEWLGQRGYTRSVGIDRDRDQVRFATSIGVTAWQSNDTVQWLRGQDRPDFVVLKDVLEHLDRTEARGLMGAVAERLSPGGRVYIAVPNANASFAARWRYIDATHQRSYTEHSIRADLQEAGLQVEWISSDDVWAASSIAGHLQHIARTLFRALRRIEAIAEFGRDGFRLPLGLNLIVLAVADGTDARR